jgi:hypothetical protein
MAKYLSLLFLLITLISCGNSNKQEQQADNKMMGDMYKPGFGEFMTYIQIHHAKLWFAGKNKNWKLADFELNEITETVEAIKKYEQDREETKVLPILEPPVDSLRSAIKKQDLKLFSENFTALTNACNSCHKAVKFEFNVVKIPENPPFSNQDFSGK